MNLLIRSLLPAAALVLSTARLSAADAIELKQQWLVGKKYSQTMNMVQTSSFALGPQKMEQKMNMDMEMSTAVSKHEDGKQKRLTVKYDRMAMKMNMNGQEMAFDSAKPGDDPLGMGKGFAGMIGKELRILATEKDEITTIENFEEFTAAAGEGLAAAQLGQMFNKDSLTEMVKQGSLKALPGKPVKPGDSWPYEYSVKMPQIGQIAIKGTYTFKKMAARAGVPCAEIAMDGTLQMDISGAATEGKADGGAGALLATMGMKINGGKLGGTVWFDPKLGMARDAEFTQEMEMSMKNPAEPTASITIPMKQTITQTLTKIEDVK